MQVLLRDRLGDQDRVRADLDRLRHQHAVRDLAAEVVRLEAAIALQAMMAVIALQVEHRVDPHAVRVRARRRAHDHHPAAEVLLDEPVDLILAHVLDVKALALQLREVDARHAASVHHEVRVALRQLLVVHDLRGLEAHLARQLQRRPARRQRVRHRQREAHLHEAVAEVVRVGLDRGQVHAPRHRLPRSHARGGGGRGAQA
jgi:hypothetical protein